jgi:hypothetical protein
MHFQCSYAQDFFPAMEWLLRTQEDAVSRRNPCGVEL